MSWVVWVLFAAGLGLLFFVSRMSKKLNSDDEAMFPDEGFTQAKEIAREIMEDETMTIEKAVTSKEPEKALADRINRKGGPLG